MMCGRFSLFTPLAELAQEMGIEIADGTSFEPSWNIAPSTWLPVACASQRIGDDEQVPVHYRLMRWGFLPSWAKQDKSRAINARAETAAEKPMFRTAFTNCRCLIPADGWFEWQKAPHGKIPWYISSNNGETMLMAGLYEVWCSDTVGHIESFCILTREASEGLSDIHHRMPVLIARKDCSEWLHSSTSHNRLEHLMSAGEPTGLDWYVVSDGVNSAATDEPALIDALPTLF